MKLTIARVAEFISAVGEFDPEHLAQGYSIDSRTVRAGQLFFAVKGERLDGHDFVEQALEKGAVAAVVRKDQLGRYPVKAKLLAVDDTLVALQTLATAVRKLWGKPLIGVTGSAGKTTTVKGHALACWQKLRSLTPLRPSSTCSTVPRTHCAAPTCWLASANDTQLAGGLLRAEQIPLSIRITTRREAGARERI